MREPLENPSVHFKYERISNEHFKYEVTFQKLLLTHGLLVTTRPVRVTIGAHDFQGDPCF